MRINKIMKRQIKESVKKYREMKKEKRRKEAEEEKNNPLNKLKKYNFNILEEIKFLEKEREKLEKVYNSIITELKEIEKKHYFNKITSESIIEKEKLQTELKNIHEKIENLTDEITKRIKITHQLE